MDKKELIKKYENKLKDVQLKFGANFKTKVYEELLEDLKQLKENKEKVPLPKHVAKWLSHAKSFNKTLHYALENAPEEVNLWFCEDEKNRQNIFADAWINGYTVKKEKKYIVKFKNIQSGTQYLKYDKVIGKWYFGLNQGSSAAILYHREEELEKAGFAWVFNCEGVELEEVKE